MKRKSVQIYERDLLIRYSNYLKYNSPSTLAYMERRYKCACRKPEPLSSPATSIPVNSKMDFYTYCELWKERRLRCRKESTVNPNYKLLERCVFPKIKELPVVEISSAVILQILREERYVYGDEVERRLLTVLRSIVNYAVGDGLLDRIIIDELNDRRKIR